MVQAAFIYTSQVAMALPEREVDDLCLRASKSFLNICDKLLQRIIVDSPYELKSFLLEIYTQYCSASSEKDLDAQIHYASQAVQLLSSHLNAYDLSKGAGLFSSRVRELITLHAALERCHAELRHAK